MVVLHVAFIRNDPFNGVCVAVPQHIKAQKQYAEVAFININNEKIDGLDCQLQYEDKFDINKLEKPFCKPDLVVFHEAYRAEYLKIYTNLLRNKIPYVIVPHGELAKEAQKKKWLKKKVANLLLFNRFINHALGVQCLSEREKKATKFGKQRFIGTNGISIPKIQKESFNKDKIKLVYIGRLEARIKGFDLLFDAILENADLLREKNCTLNLYGPDFNGRFEEAQNMIAERAIADLVTLSPAISGKEKETVLLESDLFVQTSRTEGMPMGILEAMSYGLPVLITEGTTLGKVVSKYDAGWVAKTSTASVSEKIRDFCKEELFREKGVSSRELIEKEFAWEKVAKDTLEQYRKLL